METKYDEEVDVLYIKLKRGEFAKNKKLDDLTILDLDEEGNVLGIELLDASKRIPAEALDKFQVKKIRPITQPSE